MSKPDYWDLPNCDNITSLQEHFMESAKKFEEAYVATHRLDRRSRFALSDVGTVAPASLP